MTRISIGRYDRLPPTCITCAATTDRTERVRYREGDSAGKFARLMLFLAALFAGIDLERMRLIFLADRRFAEQFTSLQQTEAVPGALSAPEEGGALSEPTSGPSAAGT